MPSMFNPEGNTKVDPSVSSTMAHVPHCISASEPSVVDSRMDESVIVELEQSSTVRLSLHERGANWPSLNILLVFNSLVAELILPECLAFCRLRRRDWRWSVSEKEEMLDVVLKLILLVASYYY